MKKKSFLSFVFIVFLLAGKSNAQNLNPRNPTNIIPPSPEVSAIAKYIDMPVSYSTGIPDITIPIFKMSSGDLSIPVSLSYHAGGIKVEETATWVGLGWNLNAGGSVSRVVRGLPDDFDSTNGYMYTAETVAHLKSLGSSSSEYIESLYSIQSNILDAEPDVFMFSAMGYSGRFYFDQSTHAFIMTPFQNIKIEYTVNANKVITGWIFTLPNGTKCFFGQDESASRQEYTSNGTQSITTVVDGTPSTVSSPAPVHTTSWQLAQVKSATGRVMNLYYGAYSQEDFGRSGETKDYKGYSSCDYADDKMKASYYHHAYVNSVLNKITSDQGEIDFIPSSTSRLDMLGDSRSLNAIIIKDKLYQTVKRFDFTYGYFISTVHSAVPFTNDTAASKRLFLQSFQETDSTQTLNKPYVFTYDTTVKLPSRLSASQDFWGFYNGKSNGINLTPTVTTYSVYGSGNGYIYGADRTVDSVYAKACMLQKIQYPTGGSTEYFFEPNRANAGYVATYTGGFQISGTTDRDYNISNNPFKEVSTNHYADTFTVSNPVFYTENNALVAASCDGCTDVYTTDCPLSATINGITDPSFHLTVSNRNVSYYANLPAGTYAVAVVITPNTSYPDPHFSLDLQWSENPDPNNLIIGGLRINKIISSSLGAKALGRRYDYHYHAVDTTTNSGQVYNMPVQLFKVYCGNNLGVTPSVTKVVSNSALPLFSDDGQVIRYTDITEYFDTAQSTFKTDYTFSVNPAYLAVPAVDNYPFGSPVQSDWHSGLLLEKKQFEKLSASYRILSDEKYFYTNYASISRDYFGLRTAPYPSDPAGFQGFGLTYYSFQSEWYLPDTTYSAQYAYNGATQIVQESGTRNYYNARYSLFKTRTKNSKDQIVENKTWYPYDFNNVTGYNISTLLTNGITEIPIRQEHTINSKLVSGSAYKYNAYGQPVSIFQYENKVLSDTASKDPDVITPSLYNLKTAITYSVNSPVEVSATNALTAYLWDNSGSFPIAKVDNASYAATAATSFEPEAPGNWDFSTSGMRTDLGSVTGATAYTLSTANVQRTALNASQLYVVTFWLKNSSGTAAIGGNSGTKLIEKNGWSLYQLETSGSTTVTVSGSGVIDELRLYPKNAQMVSYTYAPLIGLTSQCDVNNRVVYYEYDLVGRLLRIRDHDKNILKTFNYTYQETQ